MLEVAQACPRCGKHLSSGPSAARHLAGARCLPTVFAALPEPEPLASEDEAPSFSVGRRIHDFEEPLPDVPVTAAFHRSAARPPAQPGTRSFAVAWLRPPDLLEVP